MGRDPFAHAAVLLDRTERLVVATGIANIFHRHPGAMKQAQATLAEQSADRFLLGIGVSHAPMVAGVRKLDYSKPLSQMREYLAGMAESMYMAPPPAETPKTVLAALGPKMLELAASDGRRRPSVLDDAGAHRHRPGGPRSRQAALRRAEGGRCAPSRAEARAAARQALGMYITLPNYFKNWFRLGFSEDDLADGGSDRLVDALVPWGTVEQVEERLRAHRDAGATHVCIQPLKPGGAPGDVDWPALEAFAPARPRVLG